MASGIFGVQMQLASVMVTHVEFSMEVDGKTTFIKKGLIGWYNIFTWWNKCTER